MRDGCAWNNVCNAYRQIKKFRKCAWDNWRTLVDSEIEIIRKQVDIGRKFTIFLTSKRHMPRIIAAQLSDETGSKKNKNLIDNFLIFSWYLMNVFVRKKNLLNEFQLFPVCVYFVTFFAFAVQYISYVLDILIPLNESRPRQYVIEAEFFVDDQKYFSILALYVGCGLFMIATIAITTEAFTLTNAFYALGLFKIAR